MIIAVDTAGGEHAPYEIVKGAIGLAKRTVERNASQIIKEETYEQTSCSR